MDALGDRAGVQTAAQQRSVRLAAVMRRHMYENGGPLMAARETFAQRQKRELDLQLDEELEGTFPASDPPKITRFSVKSPSVADRTRKKATVPKNDT